MTDPHKDEPSAVQQIREATLRHEFRGYARTDVDELLDRLAATLSALETERRDLRAQLAEVTARLPELEQQLRQAATERDSLVRSFDDASRERESMLAAFEEVKRERESSLGYVEGLERELVRVRDLESTLTQALVTAERSGNDLRTQAQREAELVVAEARVEARKLLHEAAAERERLVGDGRAIRAMLQSALVTLDEHRLAEASAQGQPFEPESRARRLGSGVQDVGS